MKKKGNADGVTRGDEYFPMITWGEKKDLAFCQGLIQNFQSYCTDIPLITAQGKSAKDTSANILIRLLPSAVYVEQIEDSQIEN